MIPSFENIPKKTNFQSQGISRTIFKKTRNNRIQGNWYRKIMEIEKNSRNPNRWTYFVCQIKELFKLSFYKANIKNMINCSQIFKNRVLQNLNSRKNLFCQGETTQSQYIHRDFPQGIPTKIISTLIKLLQNISMNSVKMKKIYLLWKYRKERSENPSKYLIIHHKPRIYFNLLKWGNFLK